MYTIAEYEKVLGVKINESLKKIEGLKVYNITDENRFGWRCPTFSFSLEGHTSEEFCWKMNKRHIYMWNGEEGSGALELMICGYSNDNIIPCWSEIFYKRLIIRSFKGISKLKFRRVDEICKML
jgi:selenocysteine lyase/cysteine desulfurase